MKLSKNGRKTQKAIRKALLLGLPVAGLLAMAGCEKEKESKEIVGRLADPYESPMGLVRRPMGLVSAEENKKFSNVSSASSDKK